MRQFFLSLPAELEEAAAIDGASTAQTFFRIVLPLARPALATLAIFTLLSSWNDLIWPLVALSDERWYTVQVGLTMFQGTRRTQWSLLMAGNVATLPLIIAFIAAQKRFVATMTFAGLKGVNDLLVIGDANPDLVLRGDVTPRWGQAEQLLDAADLVLLASPASDKMSATTTT
jgi:ABC-type proline/glycine betaine transport system permease subunit